MVENQMTPSRFELKPLLEFLKQEFREKRPKGIDLVLVKQRAILTRGVLPDLQIRAYPGSRHLVVEDLGTEYRVYFFAENGIMAGGVNVPSDSPWLFKLWKGSRILYHLPKKVPEVRPEQAAETEYQRFVKVYAQLASLWGARPDPPLLQIVSFPTYPSTGFKLGAVENEGTRRISLEAIQSPEGSFILAREVFRTFVPEVDCFSNKQDADVLVNYLATIYSGASSPGVFKLVWENSIIAPSISHLPGVLQQRSKQEIEKYIRAIAGATGILSKIGEKLSPTTITILMETLITDFLEGRGGCNERLVVHFYLDAMERARNAKDTAKGDISDLTVKAMLAFASFAHDLKSIDPPVVDGIESSPLLYATRALLAGKYQTILDQYNRNVGQFSRPVQALARIAIAAQLRGTGITLEVANIPPIIINKPITVEIRLHNATDIPLLNAELTFSPQPAGRLQVGDLHQEGPIDLHTKLLFRCSITGITIGGATLEVRASVDHPCPGEKRITLVSRVPITIT